MSSRSYRLFALALCSSIATASQAVVISVTDSSGVPLGSAMVTQTVANPAPRDVSDNGYQQPGKPRMVEIETTAFTSPAGTVRMPDVTVEMNYRIRKPGYKDVVVRILPDQKSVLLTVDKETDPVKIAESKPANAWLGALDIGDANAKKHFQMQCGFCHQQGNAFTRAERSPEDWHEVIGRMIRYGSRLPTDLQKSLPDKLSAGYRKLRENPGLVKGGIAWDSELDKTVITEWPLGNAMSQTHDMLIAANKMIYVADNIQDRLYKVDPVTNAVTVYKIPHKPGDKPGGLIVGRLKGFPSHDSTSNAHSLAESKRDGHIFITPSAQRRLVEFDPASETFLLHEIGAGFYPHTIRIDANDNVWFTLALSNQIAKFDRFTQKFTLFDLPARGLKERLTVSSIDKLFQLMNWGLPVSNWMPVDWAATGTPLPYGIDIAPDGTVWFARLHTQEIGKIDPATGRITMIPTPFIGPRRLRIDAEGNVWIVAFAESKIARYSPADGKFSLFDLPVEPKGSETPYSLNVDKKRGIVWVNGNQSDALFAFHIKSQTWRTVPLPRRTTFTRDIEIAEDGTVYTSNSNFPSWHIEGGQPTLLRIEQK